MHESENLSLRRCWIHRFVTIIQRGRMFSKLRLLLVLLIGWTLTATAYGAVVHLNSGESLSGRIQGMDEQMLYLESDRGFGVLKVERVDIRLIEFEAAERNLARKLGIGLHYRPSAVPEERVSLKNWLSPIDSLELLIGYHEEMDITHFSLEGRFARVVLNEGGHNLFLGAGAGFESEEDERGTLFRLFTGSEFFPINYPNVGLSAELGLRRQQGLGSTEQGFYNALAARYYF